MAHTKQDSIYISLHIYRRRYKHDRIDIAAPSLVKLLRSMQVARLPGERGDAFWVPVLKTHK